MRTNSPEKEKGKQDKTASIDAAKKLAGEMHLQAASLHDLLLEAIRVASEYIEISDKDRLSIQTFQKKLEGLKDRTKLLPGVDRILAKQQLEPYREALRQFPKELTKFYEQLTVNHAEEYDKAQTECQTYLRLEEELMALELEENEVLANLFSQKNQLPALLRCKLATIRIGIGTIKEKMAEEKTKSQFIGAFLEYRQTCQYAQTLANGGYVITESRKELIGRIRRAIIESRGTPLILLTGSSGSGKTSAANEVSRLLTGKDVIGLVAGPNTDITKMFGSRLAGVDGFYVAYGPLGQVITGKTSTLDGTSIDQDESRVGFVDEITLMPPESQTELVKICASVKPGRQLRLERLADAGIFLSGNAAIIMATNVKSESKHPDRNDIPPEALREFSAAIKVGYLEQSSGNPEIFDILKAVLMDENYRMTASADDLKVPRTKTTSGQRGTAEITIDTNPKSGGLIWRLANFVSQAQKAYEEDENILTKTLGSEATLQKAVPDISKFIEMLYSYRMTMLSTNTGLAEHIDIFLNQWIGQEKDSAGQESLPAADRYFLCRLRETYGLDSISLSKTGKHFRILSPLEIGQFSPRVIQTESEQLGAPDTETVFDRDGTPYEVVRTSVGSVPMDTEMTVKKGQKTEIYLMLGTTTLENELKAVLVNDQTNDVILVNPADLEQEYAVCANVNPIGGLGDIRSARIIGDIQGTHPHSRGYVHTDQHGERISIRPAILPAFIPDHDDREKRQRLIAEIEDVEYQGTNLVSRVK